MKNVGNSAYGRTNMNKAKHNKTSYVTRKQYLKSVASPYFRDADKYGEIYEVQKRKKMTHQNMPVQISTAILQYAKLRMLQFYYDFLCKFVDRSDFNMMYMDTDSMYMAISGGKLEDLIKPEMKVVYEKEKNLWLPRSDTIEHKLYDNRTAGLFKTEFVGDGMVCLAPKLYYCLHPPYYCLKDPTQNDKLSCKGVQKSNNKGLLNYNNFKTVLRTNDILPCENKGMRFLNGGVYYYNTSKTGLTAKYNKRNILSDGVTTVPLDENQYK